MLVDFQRGPLSIWEIFFLGIPCSRHHNPYEHLEFVKLTNKFMFICPTICFRTALPLHTRKWSVKENTVSHYHKGFHWRWFQWAPVFVPEGQPAGLQQFVVRLRRQSSAWEPEPPRPHNPPQRSASSTVCCPSRPGPSLNIQKEQITISAGSIIHMTTFTCLLIFHHYSKYDNIQNLIGVI